jgi:hypothetical protein
VTQKPKGARVDRTSETGVGEGRTVVEYAPPAIELRETVAGLLGDQRGSYDRPWAW